MQDIYAIGMRIMILEKRIEEINSLLSILLREIDELKSKMEEKDV